MNTTKKVRDGKIFTIYLDKQHLEHIKRMARQMSMQEGVDISTCEAIRIALEKFYPIYTQSDFIEDAQKRRRLRREFEQKNQLQFEDLLV